MPTCSACASSRRRSTSTARRLPPVLRRRDRRARLDPDLVRVRRRAAGAARRRDDPHDPARRRAPPRRSASGRSGCGERLRRDARRAVAALRRPGRARRSSSSSPATATRRCAPSTPRSRPSTRSSASRAPAPTAQHRDVEEPLLTETLGFAYVGDGEYRLDGERAQLPLGLRRAGRRAAARRRARSTTSPGRSQDEDHLAWQRARARRRRLRHRRCATATTSARSTSASRAASCSRSPPSRPASRSTRTPSTSARSCGSRSMHEHLRERLERTLTPVVNPRARRRARRRHERRSTYRERPAAGDPAGLLVLHHGRGADEHDLLGARRRARPASGGCTWSRRARRSRCRAGPATTGTSCRASATPTPTPSTPPTPRSRSFHDELWERTGLDAGADRARRLLDGLGDELLARARRRTARRPPASWPSPASSRWSRAGSPTCRAPTRVFIAHGRHDPIMEVGFARRARELLEAGGTDVDYHECDYGHQIDPAHAAGGRGLARRDAPALAPALDRGRRRLVCSPPWRASTRSSLVPASTP